MIFSDDIWEHTYHYSEIEDLDSLLETYLDSTDIPEIVGSDKCEYLNCPASFDIETTSLYSHGFDKEDEYTAIMYHWQFGINGLVILGRNWYEYREFIQSLTSWLGTNDKFRLIVYVHNLQFEFEFIRFWFQWDKIFAIKSRRPLYAITTDGIEYRCSLLLSGYSLDYVGRKLLQKYDCKKKKGDLDYSLIRHTETPLTKAEEEYCINDVRVVMCYIQEKLDEGETIDKIPLTQTGYVRRYVRDKVLHSSTYRETIRSINYNNLQEFIMNRAAFMGGHTHAGVNHANQLVEKCGSGDITSSYPASACLYKYPMTSGQYIGEPESYQAMINYMKKYCCIFDVVFIKLEPAFEYENILSESRGRPLLDTDTVKTNNGKVIAADSWCTTMNEVDFQYIKKFYRWKSIKFLNLWIYGKSYLPKPLIDCILDLYVDKTSLKGVIGKELEYLHAKGLLNSIYGMMVTNIIREQFDYSYDTWSKIRQDEETAEKLLYDYNKKFNRFLAYQWGIYITSYSRARLYDAILEFGPDFVYCDTDSIKGTNFSTHIPYIESKNKEILSLINKVSVHYGIPISRFKPRTIKGVEKPLGLWEIEHKDSYLNFKTCGAKRYCYIPTPGSHLETEIWESDYKELHDECPTLEEFKTKYKTSQIVSFTCSGINKQKALPFLWHEYPNADYIFNYFGEGFMIPSAYSGKLTSHIIKEAKSGYITDYLGNTAKYMEFSGNCLEPAPYYMSIARDYMQYIEGFKNGYEWMEDLV